MDKGIYWGITMASSNSKTAKSMSRAWEKGVSAKRHLDEWRRRSADRYRYQV